MLFIISLISYFVGSVPFGFIIVYFFTGKNLYQEGSKNIGATNALRIAGKKIAIFTLILDSLKGFIIAAICRYFNMDFWFIPGIFAVLGHMFPIWLKFKGGKGVATALGLLLAINIYLFIAAIVTWFIIAYAFKYSSLAGLVTFILIPIYCLVLQINTQIILGLTFLGLLIIYKHKANIIRLLKNQEDKIKLVK